MTAKFALLRHLAYSPITRDECLKHVGGQRCSIDMLAVHLAMHDCIAIERFPQVRG